jgi:hypothetical protein
MATYVFRSQSVHLPAIKIRKIKVTIARSFMQGKTEISIQSVKTNEMQDK